LKIKKITSQHRRDYTAIMVCEYCGHEQIDNSGYDDAYYHKNVIPKMTCGSCGKTAGKDYKPKTTKYPEGYQV